jgi:hypothetical protein
MKVSDRAFMQLMVEALIELREASFKIPVRPDADIEALVKAQERANQVIRRAKIHLADCGWL